jgi:hypothetical protein
VFTRWHEPLAQIRLHPHESSPRRLALLRRDLDQVGVEVNVRPVQPLQLGATQPGKRADCHVREQLRRSGFEKASRLLYSQNAGR